MCGLGESRRGRRRLKLLGSQCEKDERKLMSGDNISVVDIGSQGLSYVSIDNLYLLAMLH